LFVANPFLARTDKINTEGMGILPYLTSYLEIIIQFPDDIAGEISRLPDPSDIQQYPEPKLWQLQSL
jgi:hypothetical protein